MPDKALTALAVMCGIISVACCSAAVNDSSPTTYEGADIAATSAAAGLDRQEKDMLHWAIGERDASTCCVQSVCIMSAAVSNSRAT